MSDVHAVQALVHAYRDFSECIVDAIEWADFGTTIRLAIDYVWMPDGSVRRDADPRVIVTLVATGVDEVHVLNRLSPTQEKDVSLLNWGLAEISRVSIRNDPSAESSSLILEVWRESGVWISLCCSDIVITESRDR